MPDIQHPVDETLRDEEGAPRTDAPSGQTFLDAPLVTNWQDLNADAVVFGVPYGRPYIPASFPDDQSRAPAALRAASSRILISNKSVDTDFKTTNPAGDVKIVDGGNIPLTGTNFDAHYHAAENAVRFALARGVMPIVIGGNDGVTNPVIRGLDCLDDITLIQIDAHMDWADQRYGISDGYSSPMRRASELPHISSIHQIGIRSFGSATASDMDDARRWGSHIHLARDIHQKGMSSVIDALPSSGKFFVTLDVDGMDPSVMPGTVAMAPGGLSWWHMVDLFEGLTRKGDVVGLNLVEMAPSNDLNQITMIGAGRLAMKLIMLQKIKNRHKPGR